MEIKSNPPVNDRPIPAEADKDHPNLEPIAEAHPAPDQPPKKADAAIADLAADTDRDVKSQEADSQAEIEEKYFKAYEDARARIMDSADAKSNIRPRAPANHRGYR